LRASAGRCGITLPATLTDGHAGNDELGPYIEFSQVRVSVNDKKPDLKKLWEATMATGA
jgi:hypothetical protein